MDRVVNKYDREMYLPLAQQFYDNSDFCNYGYWLEDTPNAKAACENLMQRLLALVPEKKGTILDVACGMGATTRYRLKFYGRSGIVGLNVSEKQLKTAIVNAPGCRFVMMDAARLVDGCLFENVICVEAASISDQERFLREAYRAEARRDPGASDILLTTPPVMLNRNRWVPENSVRTLEEYRAIYVRAGYEDINIIDATDECWRPFYRYRARWARKALLARDVGVLAFLMDALTWRFVRVLTRHYVLVSARKG
jgi:SAM-dependent methyltransferase